MGLLKTSHGRLKPRMLSEDVAMDGAAGSSLLWNPGFLLYQPGTTTSGRSFG